VQLQLSTVSNVALLQGDICDGKSLIAIGLMNEISRERPVFELRHPYPDMLEEASAILNAYANAVFVVENCFTLRDDHLLGLARQVAASNGKLILTARNISTEGESGKIKGLRAVPTFFELAIRRLLPDEVEALIALIDQIAGWRDLGALTQSDRRRFIEKDCDGCVPNVLLRLLNSNYVRGRYREEYNKTNYINPHDRQMVVAALLIANLGFDAPVSFLSDIFERDFATVLRHIDPASGGLRLVRVIGGSVRTIPSIGARNLLRSVVETRDIVNTIIFMLERMAETVRRTDFSQHVFSQLMRYSILSSIVNDNDEINRFFDHISKIGHFRDMPLFWLQWHMAMSAQVKWVKAEEYLAMGYVAAAAFEKRRNEEYNLKQLDDRKAKFLAGRILGMTRTGVELFRDLKQALDIVGRLMRDAELTHHPYETLVDITKALKLSGDTLIPEQRALLGGQMKAVFDLAQRKLTMLSEGYQRAHAIEAVKQIEAAAVV